MKKARNLRFLVPAIICAFATIIGFQNNVPNLKEHILPELYAKEVNQKNERIDVKKEKTTFKPETVERETLVEGTYQDGVYRGSAKGYGGIIKVLVEIKEGKIFRIDVEDHSSETDSYFKMAEKIIPQIIKKQSPNVDTISGATYSSNGIKNAIIVALNKAAGKNNVSDDEETIKEKESEKEKIRKGTPADGVFMGEALCEQFQYQIQIKVKFSKGQAVAITSMKLINNDNRENVSYCKKAWRPMVKRILKKQSNNVDTVSGATYSSNAIKDAYMNALVKAIEANGGKAEKKKNSPTKNSAKKISENEEAGVKGKIRDGVYLVTTTCNPDEKREFKSYHLTAKVIFKDGKLKDITEISSDAESNKKYYQWAASGRNNQKGVIEQLISNQSTKNLSAVSGATCSSISCKNIYLTALKMAQGETIKEEESCIIPTENEQQTWGDREYEASENEKVIQTSAWVYAIEDEYGDYDFEDYELFANVIFENGKIKDIRVIDCDNLANLFYCEKAIRGTESEKGMLSKFLQLEKEETDVVSGATCTSEALKTIYKNAVIIYEEMFGKNENIQN
ncbi:MAG: FMN-binding protein [Eubacterium sp.]|nr:FMN-binding protein [Eubacterium sp.]